MDGYQLFGIGLIAFALFGIATSKSNDVGLGIILLIIGAWLVWG